MTGYIVPTILATMGGLLLGSFFYGGLWWTIRKGIGSTRPALWFVSSLVVRSACVATGFVVISGGSWRRMVSGLLGFVVARFFLSRLVGTTENVVSGCPEAPHAS